MEKHTKKDFPNFDWHENKSWLLTGKTSSDKPVLLTNFVTGHLLQGYIPTYGGSIKGRYSGIQY
jgi:hypothetical protein